MKKPRFFFAVALYLLLAAATSRLFAASCIIMHWIYRSFAPLLKGAGQ